MAFKSDVCQNAVECEMGHAGEFCITASVLWLITGCATLLLRPRSQGEIAVELPAVQYSTSAAEVPAVRDHIVFTENVDGSTIITKRVPHSTTDSEAGMQNMGKYPEQSIT